MFFQRFDGDVYESPEYEILSDEPVHKALNAILAKLALRSPMPLAYFMLPFHRLCTGETLMTSKHKLLGLSRDPKIEAPWSELYIEDAEESYSPISAERELENAFARYAGSDDDLSDLSDNADDPYKRFSIVKGRN
jgi:hypothetical protein